jgi:long-chain fatty acid transport protein
MRNFRAAIAVSGALLTSQFLSSSAFADEFHFSNLLVGERPSGLGGAFTALSDDHTGMVYNPAGSTGMWEQPCLMAVVRQR